MIDINQQEQQMKDLLSNLNKIKDVQEGVLSGAMNQINSMDNKGDRDWLKESIKLAKEGKLTADEFHSQIKDKGYGS